MNIHSELIDLFNNLGLEGVKLHFGVLLLLGLLVYLGARRKWVPAIATIIGSYAIFFVRTSETFSSSTMVHLKVIILIIIGIMLVSIYIYYLWIEPE
jgi:hypothetical protein